MNDKKKPYEFELVNLPNEETAERIRKKILEVIEDELQEDVEGQGFYTKGYPKIFPKCSSD